jgi:hypothetical protein
MATRKKTPPVVLTREELIAKAIKDFDNHRWMTSEMIAPCVYDLKKGQTVYIGNLKNCVLVEPFFDGKAWVVEYSSTDNNYGNPITTDGHFGAWPASHMEINTNPGTDKDNLFVPYRRIQKLTSSFDAIVYMYLYTGMVCNPAYQRGYVWTPFDQEQLLSSIFERLEIGSFTLMRNHNFHNDTTSVVRNTIDGRSISIPRNNNQTIEIIDGQQRLTTMLRFWLGMIPFRGRYWSDLSNHDRHNFETTSISYYLVESDDITEKELLKMFLQANRGVPQSEEHLLKVRNLYEKL